MKFLRYFRARFFLLEGEYKDECPRCRGKKHLAETVDHTPMAVYALALLSGVSMRRVLKKESVECWLCEGRGWTLCRDGYSLYGG